MLSLIKNIIWYFRYIKIRRFFQTGRITGIFGLPRAGKTTLCAGICACNAFVLSRYKKLKGRFVKKIHLALFPHFDYIFCTDETIQNAITITYPMFGKFNLPPRSLVYMEECGLGFDNRAWKTLPLDAKRLIALIGHKKSSIIWSSQTADVDKTLRVRSFKLYLVKRSFFRDKSFLKPIDYSFGVDNDSGELRDVYSISEGIRAFWDIVVHSSFWFNRRPYYRFFDSYFDDYEYPAPTPGIEPEETDTKTEEGA